MAITGTGTEQDPYIVTTIGEVLEKCAEANAYVCLANDIYVKEDPDYRDGSNTPIIINCAKFYSTNSDGNYKSIIGYRCLASQTYNFNIITIGANVEVNHIGFLSFFNDRSSDTYSSSYSDISATDTSSINNCSISMFIISSSSGSSNMTVYSGFYNNCSMYFQYSKNRTSNYSVATILSPSGSSSSPGINNSYVCLINPCNGGKWNIDINSGRLMKNIQNSTVCIKDMIFSGYVGGGSYNEPTFIPNDCSKILFYCNITAPSVTQYQIQGIYLNSTSSIVCIDSTNGLFGRTIWYGSNTSTASKEQLSNQQFLLNYGFI